MQYQCHTAVEQLKSSEIKKLKLVHSVSWQEAYCNARTFLKMPQMMLASLKINCFTFRYLERNVQYCSMYRQYSHSIPQFLVDRPRHLVNHCMKRLDAAQSIPANDITVVDSLLGEFKVKSQMEQNVVYSIKFADQSSMPNCDYPDQLQTYLPCKHFLANYHHVPGWDWTSLLTKYRESPMLLLDDHVMKKLHPKHDAADDQTTCITNLEMPVCPSEIRENGHSILPLPTKQKNITHSGYQMQGGSQSPQKFYFSCA